MLLYAFVSGASISFPHLLLRSLNKVHRSSAVAHTLIHPIFIHRILLFLGLADFPAGEPIHVIASKVATFLRQRAAHLRVGPTRPRGASSGVVPPPPSSIGADTAEAFGSAAADADVPPQTTLDDLDIRRMLDHVLTVQATHGQILVDVLDKIRGLAQSWHSFDDLHRHLLLMMDVRLNLFNHLIGFIPCQICSQTSNLIQNVHQNQSLSRLNGQDMIQRMSNV